MDFITAKKPSDIKLAGIVVHFERVNDSLKVVTLTDSAGGICKFTAGTYDSANVTVPAPPKMEKRYVLSGELPVIGKFAKAYEHRSDATAAERDLPDGAENVSIEEREVEIKDGAQDGNNLPF